MTQWRHDWRPPERNGPGDASFTLGVLAVVFVFVPVVGDFVAVPAAVAAVVLGVVGLVRVDRGVATNAGKAMVGAMLGLVSAFATFVTLAAMGTFE
jgi:hypothetical protein